MGARKQKVAVWRSENPAQKQSSYWQQAQHKWHRVQSHFSRIRIFRKRKEVGKLRRVKISEQVREVKEHHWKDNRTVQHHHRRAKYQSKAERSIKIEGKSRRKVPCQSGAVKSQVRTNQRQVWLPRWWVTNLIDNIQLGNNSIHLIWSFF